MSAFKRWFAAGILMAFSGVGTVFAQNPADWTTSFPTFRIADNLYYVGSRDLASYLVTTPKGDILINSSLESSPGLIKKSVESLGFKFSDVKILLISHAHFDHDAGSAAIKQMTGAKYMVMDADVPAVESGGAKDFAYPNHHYPIAKVDRALHDGSEVKLGGVVLVAHRTGGHTQGNTTWTMKVTDKGKSYNVVVVGSWFVNPGYRLVDKPGHPASYPGIAKDYERSFAVWKGLPCDIFLGAHGIYFGLLEKYPRMKQGGENVWVDPAGYRAAVAEREAAFEKELQRQESGKD
jgi:metallo-beta-lactamase class B